MNKTGLIVIGYQGIGKTSLASDISNRVIDFESSLFKNSSGYRDPDWYKIYCRQAVSIAKQGFIVCTSSHITVSDEFRIINDPQVDILLVYPSLELKELWIQKLAVRSITNPSEKNTAAFLNAYGTYDSSIRDLSRIGYFNHLELDDLDYNLKLCLTDYCYKHNLDILL